MNKKTLTILSVIFATILYIVIMELLASWIYLLNDIQFNKYVKYYTFIQGCLQLIGVLIFLYFIKKMSFKNLIQKTHYKWYLIALVLGVSFVFMQTPLKLVYNILFETEYQIAYKFDGFSKFKNIDIISPILLIPIGEELFFRGYIQNKLQKKTTSFIAIIVASLLFASIHSPYINLISDSFNQNWHLFYLTIFGGLISATIYYKSNSVGPSIVFHIFWNLTAIIA